MIIFYLKFNNEMIINMIMIKKLNQIIYFKLNEIELNQIELN